MEPHRTQAHQHRCVCILDHGEPTGLVDACPVAVRNPDQPFCSACEEAYHPDKPQVTDPLIRARVEANWHHMNGPADRTSS